MASYIPLLSSNTLNEKLRLLPAERREEPVRLLKEIESLKNNYMQKNSNVDFETYFRQFMDLTDRFYQALREATEAHPKDMEMKNSSSRKEAVALSIR